MGTESERVEDSLIRVVPNVLRQRKSTNLLTIIRLICTPRVLVTKRGRVLEAIQFGLIDDRVEETLSIEESDVHVWIFLRERLCKLVKMSIVSTRKQKNQNLSRAWSVGENELTQR